MPKDPPQKHLPGGVFGSAKTMPNAVGPVRNTLSAPESRHRVCTLPFPDELIEPDQATLPECRNRSRPNRRSTMQVKQVMTRGVECISPDTTVQEAARKM